MSVRPRRVPPELSVDSMNVIEGYRISPEQERLWLLRQRDGSRYYRATCVALIKGDIGYDEVQAVIEKVVEKHEILRTTFQVMERADAPIQIIAAPSAVKMDYVDLRDMDEPARQTEIAHLVEQISLTRNHPDTDAPLSVILADVDIGQRVLILSLPSLNADRPSLNILVSEIVRVFEDLRCGKDPAPAILQYADLAAWQNELIESEVTEEGRDYWRSRRFQLNSGSMCPGEIKRDSRAEFKPATLTGHLDVAASKKAAATAQKYDAELPDFLQTCWQVLLMRLTGQSEIIVSCLFHRRVHEELLEVPGLFAAHLPISVDLEKHAQFWEALVNISEKIREAELRHEYFSWRQIPEHAQQYSQGSLCLDYGFEFAEAFQKMEACGLIFEVLDQQAYMERFKLKLICRPSGDRLAINLQFDANLFDEDEMSRLLARFLKLVESASKDPDETIESLEILPIAEREQILQKWNETAQPYEEAQGLPELIERQVRQRPEAIALVCEGQQLSYGELDRRANALARRLRAAGIGPESVVGVLMERSLEMVTGLLAALKAGGAYLPLDPGYPAERLRWMVEDSGVKVTLVGEGEQAAQLGEGALTLTGAEVPFDESGEGCDWSGAGRENLAYVIYTSGSTGRPKGVMAPHRAILNRLQWMIAEMSFTNEDRFLQKTAFGFDASIWEIFLPLMIGARVALARQGGQQDAEYLVEVIRREQITTLQFVPTHLQALLGAELLGDCRSLRRVYCGGEALESDVVRRFYRQTEGAELHNLYGPTEVAIDAAWRRCPAEEEETIPIGRPIGNAKIYLMDNRWQLQPVGVAGDLYIGGAGLARGYQNRADMTAERFLPDPWSGAPGSRLYRSGDYGRYGAGGEIEYRGRRDEQIKLRGYRIEIGEIEAALRELACVREAAVLVTENAAGQKQLTAYVVAEGRAVEVNGSSDGLEMSETQLREMARRRLPEYMAPSSFVLLKSLPVLPNGKLDRKALPFPNTLHDKSAETHEDLRTPIEKTLTGIWEQVLGIGRIGIHDNFFNLGGDSIISIQIIARANQAGLKLTPSQLFANQTIHELASVAVAAEHDSSEQGMVTGPLPLTPAQCWFFARRMAEPHHFNQTVFLTAREPIDAGVMEKAVEALFAHHDALRMRFSQNESGWEQYNTADAGRERFIKIDLSDVPIADLKERIESLAAEMQRRLDPISGPIARVVLIDPGAARGNARLLLIGHHLIVDGVSWRILIEDLQTAYQHLARDQEIVFPRKTTSFRQWAMRLQAYADSPPLTQELEYWSQELRGEACALPVDKHGPNTIGTIHQVRVSLSADETTKLLREAPKAYETQINEILVTALALTISEWTGGKRALIDMEGHGREDLFDDFDLSRTVGWFTAVYPVLPPAPDGGSMGNLLVSVREKLRGIPRRGIGYGILRFLSQDTPAVAAFRDLPQAEISFNYLGQIDQVLPETGLFMPAQESAGPVISPQTWRTHLLEITAITAGGQLTVEWAYNRNLHHDATIDYVAQRFIHHLRELSAYCLRPFAALGRQIEDIYPLAPLQEGMLFHSLFSPASGAYIEQVTFDLRGELNLNAFEDAWLRVIQRHSVLRTAFVWERVKRPMQVVCAEAKLPMERYDWAGMTPERQQQQLSDLLNAIRNRGIKTDEAPLMRLDLIRRSETSHYCVWSFHHILLDGWCVDQLLREVSASYIAACEGRAVDFQPVRPFREYIDWLERRPLKEAENYWRKSLQGFTAPTPIGSRPRLLGRAHEESAYERLQYRLPEATWQRLQNYAKAERLTVNTLVQGAWAIVLGRHSRQNDVLFGTVVAGRPVDLPGVETIVGSFINTLPVRVRLQPDMPLTEWLRQLQQTQVEARQWEYCPLVKIKQWSEAPQTQALFESLLTFENRPTSSAPTLHSFSLAIENVHHVNQNHYPLTIIANPAGVLTLQAIYQTSRYDKETISGMLEHMVLALTDMIDASQVDVAKIGTPAPVRSGGPRKTKPKPIALNPERMVEKRFFNDQQTLPLILSPTVMDLDPVNWVVLNRDYLKSALQQYGAILFRNFGLRQVSDFERFSRAICPDLFSNYGDLPREGESGNIYQSTPYPADQAILFHNEGSHLDQWPLKQMFFCVTAAERGGETPLVDCRAIYRNLDSQVLRQFIEKKLIYLRNFIDGFDIGWREFFKTSEKAAVEDLCRRAKMDFEWKENGLRTRRLCQAVARHPETGEMSFFNQIQLHHVSCLDAKARDDIRRLFSEEDYPRHVSFGDGARIENSVIEMIRDLYQQTAVAFPWMKGDALLLDNMLVAHGRSPFSGERKIVVAMGEMIRADESAV